MKKINKRTGFLVVGVCLAFSACSAKEQPVETQRQVTALESVTVEMQTPSKEEVLAMREIVLEGMSDEEIKRLTENIKVANQRMESAYLNDNIFEELSDKDSLYWNYFDQKGDIQTGWSYDGEPIMQYNRFDANNFIDLIRDMQGSIHNEMLTADLQQLIDLTLIAAETHEMEYAYDIYKILHDLDYFLLRYGIEDVGKYVQDTGMVSKYYGVLTVYGAAPLLSETEASYHVLYAEAVENDSAQYGSMEQKHEEFQNQDNSVYYYYDMECFYFDDSYPGVLNETLQTYYDSVRESYEHNAEFYSGDRIEEEPSTPMPFDSLLFQYFTYVGEDYISLVYNDVTYMGGAHPYSARDGITIDCSTGEMVSVNRFIDDSEEEIGEQLMHVLDMDAYASGEWDYYITKNSVVFFYYDPRFWDPVATGRVR